MIMDTTSIGFLAMFEFRVPYTYLSLSLTLTITLILLTLTVAVRVTLTLLTSTNPNTTGWSKKADTREAVWVSALLDHPVGTVVNMAF